MKSHNHKSCHVYDIVAAQPSRWPLLYWLTIINTFGVHISALNLSGPCTVSPIHNIMFSWSREFMFMFVQTVVCGLKLLELNWPSGMTNICSICVRITFCLAIKSYLAHKSPHVNNGRGICKTTEDIVQVVRKRRRESRLAGGQTGFCKKVLNLINQSINQYNNTINL